MNIFKTENLAGNPITLILDKIAFFLESGQVETGTHVYFIGDNDGISVKASHEEILTALENSREKTEVNALRYEVQCLRNDLRLLIERR